jgi:hypothetical protein
MTVTTADDTLKSMCDSTFRSICVGDSILSTMSHSMYYEEVLKKLLHYREVWEKLSSHEEDLEKLQGRLQLTKKLLRNHRE